MYYAQAWSLVWDERPIFDEVIEAWANGPVCPVLYAAHKGQYMISEWPRGNASNLDEMAKETVDQVLKYYGKMNAQQLSDLTHREKPWNDARLGVGAGDRGTQEITHASMEEYYTSIPENG